MEPLLTFEIEPATLRWYLHSFHYINGWHHVASGYSGAIHPGFNTLRVNGTGFYINNTLIKRMSGFTNGAGITSYVANTDFRYDNYYYVRQNCPLPPGVSAEPVGSGIFTTERPPLRP